MLPAASFPGCSLNRFIEWGTKFATEDKGARHTVDWVRRRSIELKSRLATGSGEVNPAPKAQSLWRRPKRPPARYRSDDAVAAVAGTVWQPAITCPSWSEPDLRWAAVCAAFAGIGRSGDVMAEMDDAVDDGVGNRGFAEDANP